MRQLSYQVNLSVGHKGINKCIPWVHPYLCERKIWACKLKGNRTGVPEVLPESLMGARAVGNAIACCSWEQQTSFGICKDRMVNKKDGLGISHISKFCMFLSSINHHPGLCSTAEKMNLIQEPLHEILQPLSCLRSNYNNYGLKIMSL